MNPNLNATLSAIRALLMVLGTMLAGKGLTDTAAYFWIETIAGSIMVLGPAIWGVYSSIANWRKAAAMGSQATLNMVAAGKAVDQHGAPISQFSPDATPPKAVTVASAAAIVRDFAPGTPPKAS